MSDSKVYGNNFEYLIDCMKWIDKRLREIYAQKLGGKDIPNPLKGLVISSDDIKNLIMSDHIELSGYKITEDEEFGHTQNKAAETVKGGTELYLEKLCTIFNLNIAEKIFVLMAVSLEINGKYGKIYGYFNDNINKTKPSYNLAIDVMGMSSEGKNKVRESFYDDSLFKSYICSPCLTEGDESIFMREIKIDERIINYVLGINEVDESVKNCIQKITLDSQVNMWDEGIYESVKGAYDIYDNKENPCIFLYGDSGTGKKENLKLFLKKRGKCGIIIDLKLILGSVEEFRVILIKAIREAMLCDGVFAAENYHEMSNMEDEKLRANLEKIFFTEIKTQDNPVFILSSEKSNVRDYAMLNTVEIELKPPDYGEREKLWEYYSSKYNAEIENASELASKFIFTPKQIHNTVKIYTVKKSLKKGETTIYEACVDNISHNLYKRASRVNTKYSWDQLILPEEQKSLLYDACSQVENKYKVYEDWGFDDTVAYGKGVTVAFSGPPGTGKTMGAQVMANKLNLELFKIDLSQIVSKYVGETEKNLNDIFGEAKRSNAILFFDEADSLFGKRSEVKNANDKYSNLETSYLLQKIEEYEGISVLATNYIKNIDDAFMRRIKFIINFPFPDVESRKRIWQITMPKKAPVSLDIDYGFLAETFEISGGNIKNILVYAAFKAAAEKSKISMYHILMSAKYEMQKIGKLVLSQDMKQYRHFFENEQVR